VFCALLVAQTPPSTAPQAGSDAPKTSETLRDAADRAGVLIGTAVRAQRLVETAYASTLAREYNLVEPENAMKWDTIHPGPALFDFSEPDRIVDFAMAHGMKVRGHTLVWHQQNPPWLTDGHYTPAQLSGILEKHIKTVVGHYRGKVFAWDVINEAYDEPVRSSLRSTIWYDRPGIAPAQKGTAYIEQCFRWAHEADPEALLFYNEAESQTINPKSDAIYAMVQDFRRRGVPLHGVGFEMHISNLHPDVAAISANIGRFTALGIQVHITEMDVSVPVDANGDPLPEDLKLQGEVYSHIATACLSHPGCNVIQTWGFTDKYSWIGSHSRHTRGAALPFDRDYRPKPAYEALRTVLEQSKRRLSLVVGRSATSTAPQTLR
jgi:endo-1,4-beta-xylanase